MLAAIRDPNPVIYMFHKALQGMGWLGTVKGAITDVPEDDYVLPIGRAAVVRSGRDVTLVVSATRSITRSMPLAILQAKASMPR